ncbi:lysyl-tRNA synthetase [Parvibaculum lavamentivorans DS-1]|uniref:Lysine--tRNA ligase n=1 Tax=Parvibaculum lavamentivorans (strain DS-1 / DSM 13023 / NCIMB 13966) TaxID=402881 RepID=A7HQ72_PARL1|nr:lysine--tRNA ligase [Parvibaculum lavamentivorans]ABS62055.1 lysyl-tRNA synthetase [Parvibaculum lavamentivorans DS-1]
MSAAPTAIAPADLLEAARVSKAWPFEEARKIVDRLEREGGPDRTVLFETGYGPSGLPHIGTFGEVARTTMVRHAFEILMPGVKTRLLCFSDDMDGLRKVPTNVPNQEMLANYINMPLTRVPDPFEKFPSFGEHNNARLRSFLDSYGFEYEFASSTDYYKSGRFDETLLKVLAKFDEIMEIMLPSLREERQQSYSPILPVSPRTGHVLLVPLVARDAAKGTVSYVEPGTNETVEVPVTGGNCKLQWKADWAMRWAALGVDYEMAGKDLIDSVKLASRICRVLGAPPPEGFNYELFLDEEGKKISKSKGNGLSIEDWLRYASPESLQYFMFQSPRAGKRLYFDVIPRNVDEYLGALSAFPKQDVRERLNNAAFHIHHGNPPAEDLPISFSLLLNLASASHSEDRDVLWGFIRNYAPDATPENHPRLDDLVGYAINYFHDFVRPAKKYRAPADLERAALEELAARLEAADADASAEELQNIVYDIGKNHPFEKLRDWFKALYEVLLGEEQGPRFGTFVKLYGVKQSVGLIRRALAGEDLSKA